MPSALSPDGTSSEVTVLEGQRHAAMNTAPSLFVRELCKALGR